MSLLPIRVELPTYSHSFTVQVHTGATVLDVKQAIFTGCTGQPRVEGQKLIWRGRYLKDDERISDIWKSPEEQRIVHLAVHHSAWSASPPTVPRSPSPASRLASASQSTPTIAPPQVQPPQTSASSFDRPQQPNAPQSLHQPPVVNQPPVFITFKHQNALSILTNNTTLPTPDHLESSRLQAKIGLESSGYVWPSILDEEYPVVDQSEGGGVTYERVTLEGRKYLTLKNPEGKPSARQVHALKILTYTYPLLSFNFPHLPFIPSNAVYERVASPAHLTEFLQHTNEFLQRLDLPPVQIPQMNNGQNVPDADANRLIHEIPIRALLAPLLMVIVRTLLLLYFISPARKPIIGLCIIAMIMYEMWAHVRVVVVRPFNQGVENNPQAPPQNGGAPDAQFAPQGQGQPGAQAPAGPIGNRAQPGPQNRPRLPTETQADGILDSLALTNIHSESEALWPAQGIPEPQAPGLLHKLVTFLTLLILTLHPAVWNKRRAALKQRGGQVRTEMNAMERESEVRDREDGNRETSSNDANNGEELRQTQMRARLLEQHARRPRWVKEYVQRARSGEFSDD